ncbi:MULTISPECIES: gas vesicle protein GvpG [Actinoallomurus]|uniref:gas vesicle protein GvpG n=1 Tax=Actinoallomurus TaxID=667113 RepID=UPI00209237FD|nr:MULTISPECIES: gas vesicle protein GvpG [Actinoallomurus]MCO5972539.1 gas vesicle protein GvpG [Actinoallomurus soli]MCO5998037.1 gas vesicle protein GvpG [Actinoallomurus rhizosphaericola]
MGLVSSILTLPFLPVQGVIKLGELIEQQVDQQLNSPMAIRAQLEEIERRRQAGLISEEEEAEAQQEILGRLIGGRATGAP